MCTAIRTPVESRDPVTHILDAIMRSQSLVQLNTPPARYAARRRSSVQAFRWPSRNLDQKIGLSKALVVLKFEIYICTKESLCSCVLACLLHRGIIITAPVPFQHIPFRAVCTQTCSSSFLRLSPNFQYPISTKRSLPPLNYSNSSAHSPVPPEHDCSASRLLRR